MNQPASDTAAPPPPGFLERLAGRLHPADNAAAPASGGPDFRGVLKTATPALALAARRAPIGLLLFGGVAAGVALANPKVRARIRDLGHQASAALGR